MIFRKSTSSDPVKNQLQPAAINGADPVDVPGRMEPCRCALEAGPAHDPLYLCLTHYQPPGLGRSGGLASGSQDRVDCHGDAVLARRSGFEARFALLVTE